MSTYDEELTRELQARAADVPGEILTLDDVKRAAHRLRWQRRAAVGAAAAVVVAIAVPVGLSVSAGWDRSGPDLAPSPSPTPLPTEPKHVVLTTDVVEESGEPAIPYLYDGAINLPTGTLVGVPGSYDGLARLGEGWVLTGNDASGNRAVTFADSDGQVTETVPGSGWVALSADGSLVAFTEGNQVKVRSATTGETWTMPGKTEGDGYPVGVVGQDGRCETTPADSLYVCTVYLNDDSGAKVTGGEFVGMPPYVEVADLSVDGTTSGTVSATDAGSCSEVNYGDGQALWGTCDYSLGRFSPDGGLVIGRPAYLDGAGDDLVAILDATTGALLAEFKSSPENPAMINNAVWENDRTMLATVYQDGTWTLMRMTADGELTRVTDLVGGEDFSPPLFLPTIP